MAYCYNKDQIVKFLANTETQPDYASAVELLSRKNLMYGEPAVAKYRTTDGKIKILMAVGADNTGTEILFLHETPESVSEVVEKITNIESIIGSGKIDSSVGNTTNLTDAINWLNSQLSSQKPDSSVNYNDLLNIPSINDVSLIGNKSLEELGIQPKGDYVNDPSYVHTDNNFTNELLEKLQNLANIKTIGAGLALTPEGILVNTGGTGTGSIDDSSISYSTTWSSAKINNMIETSISSATLDGGSIDAESWE